MDTEMNFEVCVPRTEEEKANLRALSEYLNGILFCN